MAATLGRRAFFRLAGAGAAALLLGDRLGDPHRIAGEDAVSHPNIIYILADDLGYGDLSCQNPDSKIPTPHMDRLAAEGMRFTDAHSGSAVCTPTRYGLLTGRYCWRTRLRSGVLWGVSPHLIEPGRMTVATLLKEHGYRTACFGKWHLGMDWVTGDGKGLGDAADEDVTRVDYSQPVAHGPLSVGFDQFFGIPASLDMIPYVYLENDRVLEPPTETIEPSGGLAFYRGGPIAPGFRHSEVMPELTRRAVGYIDDHAAHHPDRPFFLYFPLSAPHTPVLPPRWVRGRSAAGDYGDFVVLCDWAVGQVMEALDRHGLAEDTLIIITSDNGSTMTPMEEYGHRPNHILRGRKSDAWDGGHRIPFIARWPREIPAGTVTAETICLTDLLATCAALLGADLPADAGEDSYSILPVLRGDQLEEPLREATVHHSISGMFAVRQGRWKLILGRGSGGWSAKGDPDDPPGQLYDMEADLSEQRNLYQERPDVVAHLTALLERYRREGRSAPA